MYIWVKHRLLLEGCSLALDDIQFLTCGGLAVLMPFWFYFKCLGPLMDQNLLLPTIWLALYKKLKMKKVENTSQVVFPCLSWSSSLLRMNAEKLPRVIYPSFMVSYYMLGKNSLNSIFFLFLFFFFFPTSEKKIKFC